MMQFNLRDKFSLKTLLALMLAFTCFNLIHTKDFYEITLDSLWEQSVESGAASNERRYIDILQKYEEHVEESNTAEAKQFYASHHADYPASMELRDSLRVYGFYKLDKYKNIHNVKVTHFGDFKNETLLLRKCNWFALSLYNYDYRQDKAKEYCSDDYIKVTDDPILSAAIKEAWEDERKSANSEKELNLRISQNEALMRFLELFLMSLAISLAVSFTIRRYWK